MRRLVFIFVLLVLPPATAFAQYYPDERAAEQGFETSALHFQSYFLNTYGLFRFREVAVGLVDDPFLDLQLNPANLPRLKGSSLLYFDFRGDRTEPSVIGHYWDFVYAGPIRPPDPRYYRVTRQEPEPMFSFGLLAYPFRESLEKLFVGGTYQILYKEEPYYTPPSWIYYSRFGYDPWGDFIFGGDEQLPVEDRYYGEDELTTEAHLYSAFAGLPLSRDVDVGIGINGVHHARDGSYINLQSDDYTSTERREYSYYNERARNLDYDHFDINGGVRVELSRDMTAGLKIGHLSGEADQDELAVRVSRYTYNDSLHDDDWSQSLYSSYTDKRWNREGGTTYGRVSFERQLSRDRRVSGYYRYAQSELDLHNGAYIRDTSYYRSHWEHTYDGITRISDYWSASRVKDDRCGSGTREETIHQGMLNLKWELTRRSKTHVGFYFSASDADLRTSEPVVADRLSDYHSLWQDTATSSYGRYYRLEETKTINWHNRIQYWTIQIPVLLQHEVNRHFSFTVGVNRILERWKVDDVTITTWDRRIETEDGHVNDAEIPPLRDTRPRQKITEDYTAVLGSVEVTVSPEFIVRFLIEPETEEEFRINQWWLSFLVRL